jgi:predicted outer membrane repeat protein
MAIAIRKVSSGVLGLVLLLSLFAVQPVYATGLCYVNDDATGSNNGTSWTNAYTSLQSALADSCTEIWVAAGIYTPHASDRTVSFVLESGTAIYGGFAGTETLLGQRDWETNVTTLSGDLGGNDSGFTNNSENSYHVVDGSSTDNTAVLDGFTVTAGNANGTLPYNRGSGIYIINGSPTLINLNISYNNAIQRGGGIHIDNGSPDLINSIVSYNISGNSGGGVSAINNSNIFLNYVTVSNNSSASGGGIIIQNNSMSTLENVNILENTASIMGGGMHHFMSNSTLTDVTFANNSAGSAAGGMYNYTSTVTLQKVTFSSNSAMDDGGALYNVYSSNATLTNVTIGSVQLRK